MARVEQPLVTRSWTTERKQYYPSYKTHILFLRNKAKRPRDPLGDL
jgi:hypothetical protein